MLYNVRSILIWCMLTKKHELYFHSSHGSRTKSVNYRDNLNKIIIARITEISKYFRNHHNPGSLLSAPKGSLKPQLPVVTRWNSQLECIRTYLTNRPFLLNILAQHEDVIDLSIVNLIYNVGLYREAKIFMTNLNRFQYLWTGYKEKRRILQILAKNG